MIIIGALTNEKQLAVHSTKIGLQLSKKQPVKLELLRKSPTLSRQSRYALMINNN